MESHVANAKSKSTLLTEGLSKTLAAIGSRLFFSQKTSTLSSIPPLQSRRKVQWSLLSTRQDERIGNKNIANNISSSAIDLSKFDRRNDYRVGETGVGLHSYMNVFSHEDVGVNKTEMTSTTQYYYVSDVTSDTIVSVSQSSIMSQSNRNNSSASSMSRRMSAMTRMSKDATRWTPHFQFAQLPVRLLTQKSGPLLTKLFKLPVTSFFMPGKTTEVETTASIST